MVPEHKYFQSVSYDSVSRTLIAEIDWTNETSMYGDTLWKYKIIFSSDFLTIESGTVKSYDDEGTRTNKTRFSSKKDLANLAYCIYESDFAKQLLKE